MHVPSSHGVASYPLYWPIGLARTTSRKGALFQVDFATARDQLLRELRLLAARAIVISSNVPMRRDGLPQVPDREPTDPAVAVYFNRGRDDRAYVIACDRFDRVRWNMRAIGATVEALRSIERHGTSAMLEQAFSGFAQLPPGPAAPASTRRPWREVLGLVGGAVDAQRVRDVVGELARKAHPDQPGGSHERMSEINRAADDALRELGAR